MSITYKKGQYPKAYVLAPNLFKLTKGKKPPHLYLPLEHPAKLCLFHPDRNEWTSRMPIVDTIVPWIAEWLFHFELWLGSGDWHGGGEHPEAGRVQSYSRRLSERWRHRRQATSLGTAS